MAVVVLFATDVARDGCALRDVARQRVAGCALQGSYGEASVFPVDKCARKCGIASADFGIRPLVCFQPYGCPERLHKRRNLSLANVLSLLQRSLLSPTQSNVLYSLMIVT